jgi:hypothetical protein
MHRIPATCVHSARTLRDCERARHCARNDLVIARYVEGIVRERAWSGEIEVVIDCFCFISIEIEIQVARVECVLSDWNRPLQASKQKKKIKKLKK